MSKSFRFFRKNTRVMMAGLVVLCMALFVFGRGSGSGGSGNTGANGLAPVATWNGGSINQQELASLVRQRLITDQVLQRLFVEGGGQSGLDFPQRIPNLFLQSRTGFALEQEVVTTEVIADLASQAGIKISDKSVNDYLAEIGLRHVDTAGIQAVMASVGQGNGQQTEAIVFSTLRKLLAAHYYQQSYISGGYVVTPQQRWEDWRRVNERISLQAAVLPVDDFLKDVPDPSDAQLTALYNDFKDAEPKIQMNGMGQALENPNPGFREPRRVRLQFILGSVTEQAAKLESKITDEEIKDYYERNKRTEFVKSELFGEEESTDAAADEAAEGSAADADTDASDGSAAEPADADAGAAEKPAEPAAPASGEGDSSSSIRQSPFRLAALQTTADPVADEESANADAASDAKDAAEETPADASSDEVKPADADTAAADATKADQEPAAEFEPLDRVRDEIRRRLATDKAVEQLERTMGDLAVQLQTEFNRYASGIAEAREIEKELPKPSEKLSNFKPLAEARALTFERTALLTDRELVDTAVGKARDVQSQRPLIQTVFTDLEVFEPLLARDLNGDWYLASKVEDVPTRVPTFAEAKDAVKAAWKHREAAKLAEKKAQELAADAEKANTPFDQYFKSLGYTVVSQTEMFSFRYYPGANPGQGSPILSEIPELKSIGPDFMDAVFKLDGDKTIGLLNFDNSAAYVVRLSSRQYTPEELKKLFLEEVNTWLGQIDMRNEHAYEFRMTALRETVEERAGWKWDDDWIKRRQEEAAQRQ